MKSSFLTALLVSVALQSTASEVSLCGPSERIVFSCTLENEKIASVCLGNGESALLLQYRFGAMGVTPELVFPASAADGQKLMSFTSYGAAKWESSELLFQIGQHTYRVHSYSGVYDEPQAWITIREPSGSCIASFQCRPDYVNELITLNQIGLPEASREPLKKKCRDAGG